MKKIMILGAGIYQLPLIEKAKEMGHYTIAVSPDGDYPGLTAADKVYYYDIKDKENVLAAAMEEKIDGITTDQTDMSVPTVAYVAEKMGLPGIGYDCALLFTDKFLMKERTKELGLATIACTRTDSIEEARKFVSDRKNPSIIKPADSEGSRGVAKILSPEELDEKFENARQYSRTGKVILEEYIQGQEFEVDTIVVNGEVRTVAYGDVTPFEIPGIFASTTRLYPSAYDEKTVNKLLEFDKAVIKGFGLKQGVTHSEYIMDGDGEIYLLEAAARGGGTFVASHIVSLQSGLNTPEFLVKTALGEVKEMPDVAAGKCHCGFVTFYLPMGVVVSIEGLQETDDLPFVVHSSLSTIHEGMEAKAFADKRLRHAIVVKATSREELNSYIDQIREILKIKVKTDDGLKGPIWK